LKLWQKIFLLTLALIIVVVNVSSLALINNYHRVAIEREQINALSRHEQIVGELQNLIIFTQLNEGVITLSDEDTLSVAYEMIKRKDHADATLRPSLFRDGALVFSGLLNLLEEESELLGMPDYSSVIIHDDGKTYLLIVSSTILNERLYQLVSSTDISSSYALFQEGFNQVRIIGVVAALIVAGLLQMLMRGVLIPLRDLSDKTRMIAGGNLNTRVTVAGHDEVAEVARNFNTMADAIEHNVLELEKLAESRRVFIGNLAHEMKTPLTSILGFADILRIKREVSDDDRINYANVIVNETKRLQGLSGKLMELLTLGNLSIVPVKTEVYTFFDELITTLQPIMKNHKMELMVRLPSKTAYINIDRELIKSLIFNLIDNSIKASSPYSMIHLNVIAENDRVTIMVIDEGLGIPEDQIPMLTEPFFSLDKARTRKHGGAGLGLALCSEIAAVHDSQLQITSKLGEGTCISIVLDEVKDHG